MMSILIKYIKVTISYYKYHFSVEVKLVNLISTFAIPVNILRIKESNWIIEQKKKGKKKYFFQNQSEWIIHDDCQKSKKA